MLRSSPALLPEGLSHPTGAAGVGGPGALQHHVLQAPAWTWGREGLGTGVPLPAAACSVSLQGLSTPTSSSPSPGDR